MSPLAKSTVPAYFLAVFSLPLAAIGGTVQQFDASLITSARAGSGPVVRETLSPEENGTVNYVNDHTATAGASASTSHYVFSENGNQSSFRINLNHKSQLSDSSIAQSDGQIEFVLTTAAQFTIDGLYSAVVRGSMVQGAALYNISDPANVTELFFNESTSSDTGTLAIGAPDDEHSQVTTRGNQTGVLQPGTYRFSYLAGMVFGSGSLDAGAGGSTGTPTDPTWGNGPPPDFDSMGSGFTTLNMSVVPTPDAVWAGLGLFGVLGAIKTVKKIRGRSSNS